MPGESINNDRLIGHGDGTVTDSKTGLMWTVSTFGRLSDGAICEGEVNGFTWSEATELFGRGRNIYPKVAPNPTGEGNIEKELTSDTYKGYQFSTICPLSVGNQNDWRLPTVEEIWTLVHEENPYGFYKYKINSKVFGEPEDLWTATYAGKHGAQGEGSAWATHEASTGGTSIHFETYCRERRPVRLVRSGSAFNATFGQRKTTLSIKDGRFIAISEGFSIPLMDITKISVRKVSRGKLLDRVAIILGVIFLFIILGLLLFDFSWIYILISVLVLLIMRKTIRSLQDTFFHVLQIVTSNGQEFDLKYEIGKLKKIEQAIKVVMLSRNK